MWSRISCGKASSIFELKDCWRVSHYSQVVKEFLWHHYDNSIRVWLEVKSCEAYQPLSLNHDIAILGQSSSCACGQHQDLGLGQHHLESCQTRFSISQGPGSADFFKNFPTRIARVDKISPNSCGTSSSRPAMSPPERILLVDSYDSFTFKCVIHSFPTLSNLTHYHPPALHPFPAKLHLPVSSTSSRMMNSPYQNYYHFSNISRLLSSVLVPDLPTCLRTLELSNISGSSMNSTCSPSLGYVLVCKVWPQSVVQQSRGYLS